MQFLTLVPFI